MNEIKVEVGYLEEMLRTNRKKHKKAFEIAYDGFRNQVIDTLKINLKEARRKRGKVITKIDLVPPLNHTEDYDIALGMLELHAEDTVSITAEEYRNFILDDWDWSSSFSSSSSSYASSSSLSTIS